MAVTAHARLTPESTDFLQRRLRLANAYGIAGTIIQNKALSLERQCVK